MRYRRKFLFLLLALLVFTTTKAQDVYYRDYTRKKSIDTCLYDVVYSFKFLRDTLKREPFYDRHLLEIGIKNSRYSSVYSDIIDSVWYEAGKHAQKINKDGSDGINPNKEAGLKNDEKALYEDFYTNYPSSGIMTVLTGLYYVEYIYEEPVPKFKWIIQSDTTTIIGYKCIKATTNFRGRTYEVWFTPFLPMSAGPWKFNGLPGLILKAGDSKGYFEWMAIGISMARNKKIFINEFDAIKTQIVTRYKLQKLQHKRWQDPVSLILSNTKDFRGAFFIRDENGESVMVKQGVNIKLPYIPVQELDLVNYEK